MATQSEQARVFTELHRKGNPLILFNIWDAATARIVESLGAKAIATGSNAVAISHGYKDGEELPLELALANLRRVIATVDVPVTMDFESGYAVSPEDVQANVAKVIEAGAVGINFEDQIIGGEGLYSIDDQCARIRAIRDLAERADVPFFINARTDIFLKLAPSEHTDAHLDEAITRARAFADAGASGFFAPGLRDAPRIARLCEASSLPVNILFLADAPAPDALAELGVARVSYGSYPYRQMMDAFKTMGQTVQAFQQ